MNFDTLLYLPLDFPIPPNESHLWDNFTDDMFYVDNYRSCRHIAMYMDGDFTWVSDHSPKLKQWIKDHVLTWIDNPRIMIITTEPGNLNPPHIDCSPSRFLTPQHKFRYVFQGTVDSLYFIHSKGELRPHNIDVPFMMSGKWPHAMLNDSNKRKYTLAIGSPWEPDFSDTNYSALLERSYEKYKDHYLSYDNLLLKDGWLELFEQRYRN